jgi:hypothetical protein
MKSTLLLAAALAAGALPAAAQEARPLDLRVPIERAQPQPDDPASPHARRRWNAAQDEDHHARRRWNAANPPQPEARPHHPEAIRPMVQRQAAGAAGGGNRGR